MNKQKKSSPFDVRYNHLTAGQKMAVTWVRSNYYRNWRKRFGESRQQHATHCPAHIKPETWAMWYDYPFGNMHFNRYVRIVRKLLATNRI